MHYQDNQIHVKKSYLYVFILIILFGIATPVLADYIGPNRSVTTYEVEAVDYGVWAKDDPGYPDNPICNHTGGGSDCIVCEWEGSPGNPCGDAEYSYKLGTRYEPVAVTTTYPAATINGVLQNCTLQNGWCVTSPQLQITANEPVSGYQILLIEGIHNSGQFACAENPCYYPVVNEGTNTLEYWALSSWGDSSTKKTTTIKVDTVLPNLNLIVNGVLGANNWYVSNTSITAEGTDGTSGIYEKVLSIDNGNTWIPSTVLTDGVYQVDIKITDNAYNISTASTTIQVDTTTPTLSLSISGTKGNNNYYVSNVTITPNANDATSGVERIEVTVDGGAWTVIHAPVTLTDGIHTYQFRVYDKAGNMTETPVQNIKVDTTPPAIALTDILDLGDMFAYSLQDDGSGLSVVRLVIEDEKERFPKVAWEETISGNKFKSDFIWDGKWKDKSSANVGEYIIFVKASDQAGNERISYGLVTINPLSYFQVIPEFIVPESTETSNETTSQLENQSTAELTFGGEQSQVQANESTEQTFELVAGGVSNGMTSSNALPPVSNILTGALAVSAIAAAMKVVNDAQKKREEEEEQSYQQAKNQAAKLNEAEEERKAQQWLEGQAILNAQIEALQKLGASDADIQALKEQASTQGLGIAINNAEGLNTFYQEKKIAELMLIDTTEAERLEAYKSTPEYIVRQEALTEWQAQKDAEQAYQLYRQGEWASVPSEEKIQEESWWNKAVNWIDQHQPLTSVGVGVLVGLATIAVTLAVATVTLPVIITAVAIATVITAVTVATGTIALNHHFDRPPTTNIVSNILWGAGAALITTAGALAIVVGCATPVGLPICSAVPPVLDTIEEVSLHLQFAYETATGNPNAGQTYIELQLELNDGGLPGNTLLRETSEQLAKLGPDALELAIRYGDDAIPLLLKYGDGAVDIIGTYGDEGIALLTLYGDDAVDLIATYGIPSVNLMKNYGDDAIRLYQSGKLPAKDISEIIPATYYDDIIATFENPPSSLTLNEDLIVYRYWGGSSPEIGNWVTLDPTLTPEQARVLLALPNDNLAINVTEFTIPAGTNIVFGEAIEQTLSDWAGPYATGGGLQIYVPNSGVLINGQ